MLNVLNVEGEDGLAPLALASSLRACWSIEGMGSLAMEWNLRGLNAGLGCGER